MPPRAKTKEKQGAVQKISAPKSEHDSFYSTNTKNIAQKRKRKIKRKQAQKIKNASNKDEILTTQNKE